MRRGLPLIVPLTVALVSAAALAPTPARAEDARAALAHYQKGTTFFKVEKWREALAEYQAAYIDKPDASFLFNIAQCHRKVGAAKDALRFYRKYLVEYRLDTGRDAPNASTVQKLIEEMEVAITESTKPPPPAPAAPPVTVNVPVTVSVPTSVPPRESEPSAAPRPSPQPRATSWEPAPQTEPSRAPTGRAASPRPPTPGVPLSPPREPARDGAGAVDRYAASPVGIFFLGAGIGYAMWLEDVTSDEGGDRGNYDTRASGPTVTAGGGLGVGYGRFFALGDIGYRFFRSARRGGFLPAATLHGFEAGVRAGLRSDHIDAWGRLGWAMTSIGIPNNADDLPTEKLAGFTAGGGVDFKDVTARQLTFSARLDIGLSGERQQETAFGRDLSEGDDQRTIWTQWAGSAGWPLARGLDLSAALHLRFVNTTFSGYSERLVVADANTARRTTIVGLTAGLVFRR